MKILMQIDQNEENNVKKRLTIKSLSEIKLNDFLWKIKLRDHENNFANLNLCKVYGYFFLTGKPVRTG